MASLCYLNLHHLFDAVVTFDDTKMRKPNREPFVEALKGWIEAHEAIMIGDWAERDVVGACAGGDEDGLRTVR